MKRTNLVYFIGLISFIMTIGCSEKEPPEAHNEEELITDLILTFSPEGGTGDSVFIATDPDGEGPLGFEAGTIRLVPGTNYELDLQLKNSINNEDLTAEIRKEADDHMFLFAWSDGLFENPQGSGNIDDPSGTVNYGDYDSNQLPLGLITTWTTATKYSGTFRVVLKHQPDIKTESSGFEEGATEVDVTFDIVIE